MTTTLPTASDSGPGAPDPALRADGRRLADGLAALIRVIQFRDRDRACCYDVSVSQCYALEAIVDEGGLTVNDLAGELYLDKSTASRIANGLVDLGYVRRERDPDDGRVVRLIATGRGRALHARIRGELVREYGWMLADLEPGVRDQVVTVVERLTRSFASRVDASGGSCCTLPVGVPAGEE